MGNFNLTYTDADFLKNTDIPIPIPIIPIIGPSLAVADRVEKSRKHRKHA